MREEKRKLARTRYRQKVMNDDKVDDARASLSPPFANQLTSGCQRTPNTYTRGSGALTRDRQKWGYVGIASDDPKGGESRNINYIARGGAAAAAAFDITRLRR